MKRHKKLWWLQIHMGNDTFGKRVMSLLIAITASCYQHATGMKTNVIDMNDCSLFAVSRFYSLCYACPVIVQRFLGKKWSADIHHESFL